MTEGGGAAPLPGHVLPVGTRLADYRIDGLIGEGGFGIVYLATDHSLERRVALKEYMPSAIASRAAGATQIVVKSERHRETFRAGLRSFVNEARLLARFDHPSLVKVFRFWEANGTAYMVMPYYEGPTLKAVLESLGRPPSEAELRAWLAPLLDALAVLHAAHCYHRDIAPDNIMLAERGPLLLDFGAARRVIGDMTHALTVVLKPGFAPIEQYGEAKSMAQGAWTDLYALASVVRFAITGTPPVSAVERLMEDRLEPLAELARGRYPARFLEGIDHALAVRPQHRPQDTGAFRDALGLAAAEPVGIVTVPSALDAGDGAEGADTTRDSDARATPSWQPTAPDAAVPPHQGPARETSAETAPRPAPTRSSAPARMPAPLPAPFAAHGPAPAPAHGPAHGPAHVPTRVPTQGPAAATGSAPLPAMPVARRRVLPWLGAALAAAMLVGGLVLLLDRPAREAPARPAPAASSAMPGRAPAMPEAAPSVSEVPLAPPEPASAIAPRTGIASAPRAAPEPAPARTPPPPAARREALDPQPVRRPAPAPAARRPGADRCSDILRKGSLEPLTAEESATLRRDCR